MRYYNPANPPPPLARYASSKLQPLTLYRDASGAERKEEDDTATAILKKKKKPNQLMYAPRNLTSRRT